MLISFLLRRFIRSFALYCLLLAVLLGFGNIFLKLSLFSNVRALWIVFCALIPLMITFALPLAAGMAVYSIVSNLYLNDEITIIRSFIAAKRALWGAGIIFSALVTMLYIPLVFHIAPARYGVGKQALLTLAKQQFDSLEAGVLHVPFPGASFYCAQKKVHQATVFYTSLFLALYNKHNERYFFTAHNGTLCNDTFVLIDGCVYTITAGKHYAAHFKETTINLAQLFVKTNDFGTALKHPKFLVLKDLLPLCVQNNQMACYEFFKRLAQIMWLLLFPLLALLFALLCGAYKNRVLMGICCNGFLFLCSHITLTLAQVWWHIPALAFFLLFGIPVIMVGIFLWWYQRYF